MKSMTFAVINDELFEQENETAQKYITCPVGEKKKHNTYLYTYHTQWKAFRELEFKIKLL